MVKVQIAGIKTAKEAIQCARLGVDAIGLLVGQKHFSDDFISINTAQEIIRALPPFVDAVVITHLEDVSEIIALLDQVQPDAIQLHSYIKDEAVKTIKKRFPLIKIIRLIHVGNGGQILNNLDELKIADAYITDSLNTLTNQFGGTGLEHDYTVDAKLRKELKKPLILAGGLTVKNVKALTKLVKPYAVDSNTGTKGTNGFRDLKLVKKFTKEAKKA
ncbi:MAG: phosphoribosylanthranilate isomerase [Erysipelotrichaceae bacterium]|jgi:phosphoribosylanthranilate isomerase|nr:phosphoribosylanthranilate isomerase [Erysipelotrichaceae bacterium]